MALRACEADRDGRYKQLTVASRMALHRATGNTAVVVVTLCGALRRWNQSAMRP